MNLRIKEKFFVTFVRHAINGEENNIYGVNVLYSISYDIVGDNYFILSFIRTDKSDKIPIYIFIIFRTPQSSIMYLRIQKAFSSISS